MIKLLRKLLGLCEHEFEIVDNGYINNSEGNGTCGNWYHWQNETI